MLYLDKNKITKSEIEKTLFSMGYFKTNSRRYARYERSISANEKATIELTIYNSFIELSFAWTSSLGFMFGDQMKNELEPLFQRKTYF